MNAQKKNKLLLILNFVIQLIVLLYLYVYLSQARTHLVELNQAIVSQHQNIHDLIDVAYTFLAKAINILPVALISACIFFPLSFILSNRKIKK